VAGFSFFDSESMKRRRGLGLALLAALLPGVGLAMFAEMSDAELLQGSVLVVMGTWIGEDTVTLSGGERSAQIGVVAITEVLKGAPGQTVALVAVPHPTGPRTGSDIRYRKGEQGLWLLRPHRGSTGGLYLADSPQRFVPMPAGAARIQTLRKALAPR
jgi:hypothetical protein